MMRITLVIPIYNGANYLERTIPELEAFHNIHPLHEVIFVNDGSTDETAHILQKRITSSGIPAKLLSYTKNKGKGYALRYAIENAQDTDIIGFTDVEIPYGLETLPSIIEQYHTNPSIHIIIGKREQTKKAYNILRLLYTKLFRFMLPKKVRQYTDTQCGFKFFRYEAAKQVFSVIKTHYWVFDIELLLAAQAQKLDIMEVPVTIKPSCKTRGNISMKSHAIQIMKDMRAIKQHEKKGNYHNKKI